MSKVNRVQAIQDLGDAQEHLKRARDLVPAQVAPQSAKKIRSALKSIEGAIRHCERMISESRSAL